MLICRFSGCTFAVDASGGDRTLATCDGASAWPINQSMPWGKGGVTGVYVDLALRDITADWCRAATHWKEAMHQFAVLYEGRFIQQVSQS